VDGFEWIMEIKDGMTAPVAHMTKSLEGLEHELRRAEAEIRDRQKTMLAQQQAGDKFAASVTGGTLKGLRLEAADTRAKLKDLKSASEDGGAAFGLEAAGALGLTFGLTEIVAKAREAAAEMGRMMYEGLSLAVEMGEQREHLTRMFTGLSGGDAAGEAMYASVQRLRKEVPQSEVEIAHWAATLEGAGMTDPSRVEASIKAMASASALMGGGQMGGEASSKVQALMAKSLETGRFKGMGRSLVGTGLSAKDLADQLGMTEENFQRAFQKGTISAQKGIDAMTQALSHKGADALAGSMGEVPTMIAKTKESLAHMFEGVDTKQLTGSIKEFLHVLDATTPSGKMMQSVIVIAFTSIGRVAADLIHSLTRVFLYIELGILRAVHMVHQLEAAWDRVTSTIGRAAGVVKNFAANPVNFTIKAIQSVPDIVRGGPAAAAPPIAANPAAPMKGPSATPLKANSDGGIVKAASGEGLASVAPGEAIVPKGKLSVGSGSPASQPMTGGDHHTHVDVGGIHVDGAGTSAPEILAMLESAIADIFERCASEAGA